MSGNNRPCGAERPHGRPTRTQSPHHRELESTPSLVFLLPRKLLTDAAPAPVMAANDELARLNDEITRLRRKTKRQRAVIKELQDKVSDVQGENRHLEVELAKKENAAVQAGVERNRAEDQLDEERREHRATREDFHRRSLELMSAARPDPAPAIAANDEITRLRAEIKELRDKHDHVQDVNRGLQAAVERWIHDARQEGVARLRAEDQLDDERSEYRTYREQTHRQMLAIMPYLKLDWPAPVNWVFGLHEYLTLDLGIFTSQACNMP